jgi:WD40 repeat protein
VNAIDFTDDGRHLVSASDDHTLKIWDLQTGQTVRTLTGHSGHVRMVKVVTNKDQAVSGAEDGLIKVWDLQVGQEIGPHISFNVPEGFRYYHFKFAFSSNGHYAIAATDGDIFRRTFEGWDLQTGRKLLRTLAEKVVTTPDSLSAIFVARSGDLEIWNLRTGREEYTLGGHKRGRAMKTIVCTADCQHLISSSSDDTVRVWNLQTGREVCTFLGHLASPHALAITSDSRYVVSAATDQTVKVWELQTGLEVASAKLDGSLRRIAIARDDRTVVVGGNNGNLYCLQLPETV